MWRPAQLLLCSDAQACLQHVGPWSLGDLAFGLCVPVHICLQQSCLWHGALRSVQAIWHCDHALACPLEVLDILCCCRRAVAEKHAETDAEDAVTGPAITDRCIHDLCWVVEHVAVWWTPKTDFVSSIAHCWSEAVHMPINCLRAKLADAEPYSRVSVATGHLWRSSLMMFG